DNGHFFRAVFTNANGVAYSRPAVLEVNPAPMITMNPGNAVICANSNASFTVGAAGSALSYQWQVSSGFGYSNVLNGAPYSGATMPTLTITNGTAALDGNLYRCIVAAAGCGPTVSSSGAVLSVDGVLPFVYAPAAIAVAQSVCQ
ncbi:MAG TPA: hypothetical protein VGR00_05280, partial [Thermoanaerobaculia bacterium]|nr:hypothetical protein [Thermoanaerobaculia bacterium]